MEIELRVVLLGVGLLILLVVAYDFFKRKPATNSSENMDVKPKRKYVEAYVDPDIYQANVANYEVSLPDTAFAIADDLDEQEIVADKELEAEYFDEQEVEAYEENMEHYQDKKVDDTRHIITLTIKARDKYGFEGATLLSAFEAAELEFGKNSLFHRIEDNESIFCVVNAMEPGYFMLETLTEEHVPGITLILLPDNVANPVVALDKMVRIAKQLAFALNGEILDHFKSPLTLETIDQYRREVEAVIKRKH